MAKRDLSRKQFLARLSKEGMAPDFMGYVRVMDDLLVYPRNAGDNRRRQLAYLLAARARHISDTQKHIGEAFAGHPRPVHGGHSACP